MDRISLLLIGFLGMMQKLYFIIAVRKKQIENPEAPFLWETQAFS